MPSTSVFTIFSAVVVLLYAVGVHYLMYAPKDRACLMTYMFEYPQFVVSYLSSAVCYGYVKFRLRMFNNEMSSPTAVCF